MDPHELLAGPGCAWWSADTLDRKGNGLCVSWGFGHPEARRGEVDAPAKQIGSLEVLVFSQGTPSLWLHQRFVGEDTSWRGTVFRFGASQIEMLQDLRARIVIVRLDCQLPRGQRLEGTVEVAATPSEGSEALFGSTLLAGPGKGQGALTVHGRPFTVIGDGSLMRRAAVETSVPHIDILALHRDHTVLLSSEQTDDGWQTRAASIDRQGHVGAVKTLSINDDRLQALIDGEDPQPDLNVAHDDASALELRDLRAVHPAGRAFGLWQAEAMAPMELARPSLVRTWPATVVANDGYLLNADGSGPREARRLSGAVSRKHGLFERLLG